MKNKALPGNVKFWAIDLNARPTIGGVPIWDGTHHGDTDPNGPIGPSRDISNGF